MIGTTERTDDTEKITAADFIDAHTQGPSASLYGDSGPSRQEGPTGGETGELMAAIYTYQSDAVVMIIGVGLMGQHLAGHLHEWMSVSKLILVDHQPEIRVGTDLMPLAQFAASLAAQTNGSMEVAAETVDITSEEAVQALFTRHQGIHYLLHTAGISPKPLTPPEQLSKFDVLNACEVNLWGTHNVIKQGVNAKAFAPRARGVLLLSTSATVGAEGRASSAYEESKGGLWNLLRLQSRHFVEQHQLILNGIAPSPLRGQMAAQNPTSAGRLQAVEEAMPLGALTEPKHISAATMYFWAEECWCVGEVLTTDGGYTKHRPIYGPLPG